MCTDTEGGRILFSRSCARAQGGNCDTASVKPGLRLMCTVQKNTTRHFLGGIFMKKTISMFLALCLLLTIVPFGGMVASAAEYVDVQFRSMDDMIAIMSYYHDRNGNNDKVFLDTENFVEGSGAVGGVVKANAQDLYLFMHDSGARVNAAGAEYLTMDVYVSRDNMLDGAEQYWSDVRADDEVHVNQNGEYDNPPLTSMPDNANGIRKALTGLKKGWNHVVVHLDKMVTATDLSSMRIRLTSGGKMTNCLVGDEVLFDDIRLVNAAALNDIVPKRNAAKDVTAMILQFPEIITLGEKDAVMAAKAAYDAVDADYQSLVIGVDTLNAAVARIEQLEDDAASAEDKAAAAEVDALINAIGDVTLEDATAIADARAAYNALTEMQKGYVTNINTLISAEKTLAALQQQAADQVAADPVIAQINALPTVDTVTIDDEDAVKEADFAYNALTKEQKALVNNYQKVLDLLGKITELKLNQAAEGFVVDGKLDEFYKEKDNNMNIYHFDSTRGDIDAFYANGGWDNYFDDVDHSVDFWTAYDETFIYVYVRSFDTDLNDTGDFNRNDSIGLYLDPDYMSRSKSNNPEGHFYEQTDDPKQGDVKFRLHGHDLTLDDMTPHAKVSLGNMTPAEYLSDSRNFCAFYFDEDEDGNNDGYGFEVRIPRFDDESGMYGVNIACGSYREDYSQQYTYSFGKSWWMDYSSMVLYEFNDEYNPFFNDGPYEDPNKVAAEAVDALISAIPATVTAADRAAIEAARAAFDALTPLQKVFVTGLEKLEKAEADLKKVDPDGGNDDPTPPVDTVRGDVDGDGKTSAADALEVLKFVVGKTQLTAEQKEIANLNGDSGIGADDALVILRIVVGKE